MYRALGLARPRSQRLVHHQHKRYFTSTVSTRGPPTPATPAQLSENFIDGTSANYVEQIYLAWLRDPNSVHKSWSSYFRGLEQGAPPGTCFVDPNQLAAGSVPLSVSHTHSVVQAAELLQLGSKVSAFVRSYRVFGHKEADLDPLRLKKRTPRTELTPADAGLTPEDMKKDISGIIHDLIPNGFFGPNDHGPFTIEDLHTHLRETYSGRVGIEFMHVQNSDIVEFFVERLERRRVSPNPAEGQRYVPATPKRLRNFKSLLRATSFEEYLGIKCQDKRFGCDGAEVIIPGMESLVDAAASLGVDNIVIGMAHRGRLNVLANVMQKPLPAIFHEFASGTAISDHMTGDVKYHLGTSCDRTTPSGPVHLSLMANPSHLEAVNPLVEGKVKARQSTKDKPESVMSLIVHGDASFAGQGIVYETIQMSGLPRYGTGGTFHVILNNQIGFTTEPQDSRPGEYCTDVALSVEAPIFHVNGDDVDAVCWVFELAAEYRQTFHKDVVVDIVCYRRHGHNEKDNPEFTQPIMYKEYINKHPKTVDVYSKKLQEEGLLSQEQATEFKQELWTELGKEYENSKSWEATPSDWLTSKWAGFKGPAQLALIKNTGINETIFNTVAASLTKLPAGFQPHSLISRILKAKEASLKSGQDIDWATAEALAFGSLMVEGFNVRLSGQDVERGTFSHRHAVVHDQSNDNQYTFLHHIEGAKGNFTVSNSFLSEYAVLGFELGYSLENPNNLVIWEAQFGDFSNGAQIILDQFLSSGEQKWVRQSGLVLLLPHGFEGQGPEHSSARLERFLMMHDADPNVIPPMDRSQRKQIQTTNWQVVNCTTPANYFHVLRRQLHREFRKPLVVFSPKSLLRHPLAKSPRAAFSDTAEAVRFIRVYWDSTPDLVPPQEMKKVIFCSGKVYYDLLEERKSRNLKDVALIRIEQLAPFPFDGVGRELERYPNAQVVWCQEEPRNQGAWTYIYFNMATTLKSLNDTRSLHYVGRPPAASPATGSSYQHKKELSKFLSAAFEE